MKKQHIKKSERKKNNILPLTLQYQSPLGIFLIFGLWQ